MASVTTNYGFDVPTSSDLVKNGATAISTLGQDIDTFLFRPFTRNGVLNSSMNVWQRGTSAVGSTTAFSADRWQSYRAVAGSTFSRQVTGDTTNLPNIQYCARIQRDSGNTATTAIAFFQNFETMNSIPYAGKTITYSFYARAGSNYSATSSLLAAQLVSGTGTDQNVISGYTGTANVVNQTATLTTTWQRFSYTAAVASTVTELSAYFQFNPVGTASTNDYFEVTGVMLEVGNQASPYTPATPTYATELAACQRYYLRWNGANGINSMIASGISSSTTGGRFIVPLPVTMRTTPTVLDYSTLCVNIITSAPAITALTYNGSGLENPQTAALQFTVASGLTAGNACFLGINNSSSGYLGIGAEL
jgi:hypothetical protein